MCSVALSKKDARSSRSLSLAPVIRRSGARQRAGGSAASARGMSGDTRPVRSDSAAGAFPQRAVYHAAYNSSIVVRSAPEQSGRGAANADSDAVVLVEGLSKEYARPKLMLFPPVLSIFHRELFKRNKTSKDEEASVGEDASASKRTTEARRPAPAGRRDNREDDDLDDLDDEDDDDDEDDEDAEGVAVPAGPREMFWALKDVSFRLDPGEALGVLGDGGPASRCSCASSVARPFRPKAAQWSAIPCRPWPSRSRGR